MIPRYFSGGVFGVPRNIRCSKKCANPDFPGSNSLREPVCTGMSMLTRLGNPVGTTITLRPLASVRSVAANGITSLDAEDDDRGAGACAVRIAVSVRSAPVEAKKRANIHITPFALSVNGAGLDAFCHPFDLFPYAQQVSAPEFADVTLGVAATDQLQRDIEGFRRAVPPLD